MRSQTNNLLMATHRDSSTERGFNAPQALKASGQSLQEIIVSRHGVPPRDLHWFVYRQVFPLRARFARNLRLFFGGDPFDAESAFVDCLIDARTHRDLEDAFREYRWHPARRNKLWATLLGSRPCRHRVKKFFDHVTT
jgi:hypothetical protein